MPRKYRPDADLEFLRSVANVDLEPLVLYLTGNNEDRRWTETLTIQEECKLHGNDYQAYIDEIIFELQLFGGNTLVNMARGQGVLYCEILKDVCSKLSVKVPPDFVMGGLSGPTSVPQMEHTLLQFLFSKAIGEMSEEELRHFHGGSGSERKEWFRRKCAIDVGCPDCD